MNRRSLIDLNADLGEGFGIWTLTDDTALLSIVSTANVACGFHAGDAPTMRHVCRAAALLGVRVGAHVAYRDLAGFGRYSLAIDPSMIYDEVLYQIGALAAFTHAAGSRIRHVKPHGALYHDAARDEAIARAVVAATHDYDGGLAVMGLPGSGLQRAAVERGITFVAEGFADRAYNSDGSLVPRSARGVHEDSEVIIEQALALATGTAFRSVQGDELRLDVDSICVHGDTPGAVHHARALREALGRRGFTITSDLS
jgi:UPF0271 protein